MDSGFHSRTCNHSGNVETVTQHHPNLPGRHLVDLPRVIRETLSEKKLCRGFFFNSQAGTSYPTRQHFLITQTQIQGYSLNHVNRALQFLSIAMCTLAVSASVFLSKTCQTVSFTSLQMLSRLWCSNMICQVCTKASVLVLSLSSNMFMLEENEEVALEVV